MADEKKPAGKFYMDSEAFIIIWRNHLRKDGSDYWNKFVGSCFGRFVRASEPKNIATLDAIDPNWRKWPKEKKVEYLSEKCYSKCINIAKKLAEEEDFEIDLPHGYLNRTGTKSKRLTTKKMRDLFMESTD